MDKPSFLWSESYKSEIYFEIYNRMSPLLIYNFNSDLFWKRLWMNQAFL